MNDVGLRLKLFRIAADLKQKDVAASIGITSNFVSMLERGKREPTLQYLRAFADLVGVPVSVILWEPGKNKEGDGERADLYGRIAALMAEYANFMGVTSKTEQRTS